MSIYQYHVDFVQSVYLIILFKYLEFSTIPTILTILFISTILSILTFPLISTISSENLNYPVDIV